MKLSLYISVLFSLLSFKYDCSDSCPSDALKSLCKNKLLGNYLPTKEHHKFINIPRSSFETDFSSAYGTNNPFTKQVVEDIICASKIYLYDEEYYREYKKYTKKDVPHILSYKIYLVEEYVFKDSIMPSRLNKDWHTNGKQRNGYGNAKHLVTCNKNNFYIVVAYNNYGEHLESIVAYLKGK